MILVGQYDSPFVRRVAVTLNHYKRKFERQILSVYGDFDDLRAINPLGTVPALRLDNGEMLFGSSCILDHLDAEAGPDLALTPADGAARRRVLRVTAIALGLAEKAVAYRGETQRRAARHRDPEIVARLETQIATALAWLEARCGGAWLCGDTMTQADVTATVAATYLQERLPGLLESANAAALMALRGRCEALPDFAAAPFEAD